MACMSVTLCQSFPLPKRFSFKSLHHLSVHRCVYQQYTVKSVTWYSVTNQRSAPTTTPFIVSGRIEHRRHTSVCCAAERLQPKWVCSDTWGRCMAAMTYYRFSVTSAPRLSSTNTISSDTWETCTCSDVTSPAAVTFRILVRYELLLLLLLLEVSAQLKPTVNSLTAQMYAAVRILWKLLMLAMPCWWTHAKIARLFFVCCSQRPRQSVVWSTIH